MSAHPYREPGERDEERGPRWSSRWSRAAVHARRLLLALASVGIAVPTELDEIRRKRRREARAYLRRLAEYQREIEASRATLEACSVPKETLEAVAAIALAHDGGSRRYP